MAAELDAAVADFRARPLDRGSYTFVAANALVVLKSARAAGVVNVHTLVATGVNGDRHREILGLQVSSAENGAGWLGFLRGLTAHGMKRCPPHHPRTPTAGWWRDWGDPTERVLAALPHSPDPVGQFEFMRIG